MTYFGKGLSPIPISRRQIVSRFTAISALAGLLLGIFEAALLRSSPRIEFLLVPDLGWVEWFLAPLLDMVCFALLGLFLGWLAARNPSKRRIAFFTAADIAAVATFVGLRIRWLHSRTTLEDFALRKDVLVPLAFFAAEFAVGLAAVWLLWKPVSVLAGRVRIRAVRLLAWSLAAAGMAAFCGVAAFLARPASTAVRADDDSDARPGSPNIVLIILDTVRADHLSAYGYPRPTTPHLDRLASEGVLFENAISPSSWTLASHASIFTGLLPHQNGADWAAPLPAGPHTLAEILRSQGYETAGFASNFNYCQKGWGIARGFDTYVDISSSFRHNLAGTLLGTALIQPAYQRFCRFDYFERENAQEVNRDVFDWFERRPKHPFFLFINYFDTHVAYLTEPPYDHRFGKISDTAVHKLFDALQTDDRAEGITPVDRASLISGYDDCLAYLDAQVGRLLDFLRNSREGKNTIVIVTADHGEAFGEQGWYSHGYNLYREVLHVPLIIAGPGVPRGVQIQHLVRTRDLFSTVLDFAGGGSTPFSRESLARFWKPGFTPQPFDDFAVSELVPVFNEGGKQAMISLTTPEWQYIYNSNGRQELYRWVSDPLDQNDLARSPGGQAIMASLHKQLVQAVAESSGPWRDQDYLFARSSGSSFFPEIMSARRTGLAALSRSHLFIGASQAYFGSAEDSSTAKPATPDQESLKSLPYH
jgi:arylsulfatase A-like enzyme